MSRIRTSNTGDTFSGVVRNLRFALALLLVMLSVSAAHAACSTKWAGKAWFNEYFFGSGIPNFLEVYSTDNSFPAKWQGWSIDVYEGLNDKITYPLTTSTSTACTVGSKTWLTTVAVGGVRQQSALVLLRDDQGAYVDAFVFDNTSPPAPWRGSAAASWFPALNTPDGCPSLAASLDTQASKSGTTPKQYNMLILGSYGNKDMARDPDGGPVWDLTSNTGAGTTYTQCVSNNANFTKTVDNSAPAPGSTITYTLNMANTGNSSMSGVTIVDSMPPAPLTFISATPSNPLDPPVTMSTYSVYDPYLQTNVTAPRLTWKPAAIPGNSASRLYVKMQVADDAVEGRSYLNTAQTVAGLSENQTDYANITIGSANTPSFAITVSPATSSTCTPALLGPKVTITAMSAANGGGTKLTGYNGTVTLTASRPTPRWYNSAGVALTGNTVSLQNGEVNLYLRDSVAETFTVSAIDASTYPDVVMIGTSGNITFTDDTTGVILGDGDNLSPAYGVVAGRPHAVRAAISSCGTTSSTTGTYSGTIHYVPGLNHPSGAAAPTINTTAPSCPGNVPLTLSSTGSNVSLNFSSGVAVFYLCTTDVGQYALNLRLNDITRDGASSVSSNFTVRPFAITATKFTRGGASNPLGASKFTAAGSKFSGTLQAWRWLGSADDNTGPRGDGLPDDDITAGALVSGAGTTLSFSGAVNNAGVVNLAPAMVTPASGKLGTLAPASATLTGGAVSLVDAFSYSEVGNIRLAGSDSTGKFAVTNYLGAPGVNVPLLSDVVGRFIPDHFRLSNGSVTAKPACSGSPFSYMGEPFNVGFTLTAMNASGAQTENYEGSLAFLDPAGANWTPAGLDTDGSFGLGAFDGTTDLSARLAFISASASGWNNGSNQISASVRFERGPTGPDGPYALRLGVAPRDLDGVALRPADLTLAARRAPAGTSARNVRFGRLRPFSTFVAGQTALNMSLQTEYWSGKSWVLNSDDHCTSLPTSAVTPTAYIDAKGAAVTGQTLGVAAGPVPFSGGRATLGLTRPAGMTSGSVDLCFDLGAGTDCVGTTAGLPYLQWGTAGSGIYTDPRARASFGIYTPESRRVVHVRELF